MSLTPAWKPLAVSFIVVMLAGAALGIGGLKYCFPRGWHGEGRYTRMLERFSSKLDLTPEQKAQVAALLEAKRQKIKSLRSEIRPKFEEIRHSTRDEIRKLLTPEQEKKFQSLERRWESRWEKRKRDRAGD